MKTRFFMPVLMGVIMTIGCNQQKEKSARELLENTETRSEVFDAILKNRDYSAGFMEKMMEDENCKSMFVKNLSMMKIMCMSEKMDTVMNDPEVMEKMTKHLIHKMKSDDDVCDKTCANLVEEEHLRLKLKQLMEEQDQKVKFNK